MFPSSRVIDTPVGGDPITISRSLVSENQSPGLSCRVIFMILRLAILVQI